MMRIAYLGAPEGFEAAASVVKGVAELTHLPAERVPILEAAPKFAGLIDASMKVSLDAEILQRASSLRIISTATTGSDHIDLDTAEGLGIRVRTLREDSELLQCLTPAAELSWALILACARRLVPATRHVRDGEWVREEFPGLMLNGRTLGLIGCGRIGQWMARYGQAFGMTVIGFDPHVNPWPKTIEAVDLDKLVREADFVSVHVHLGPETKGLVGAQQFQNMKPGAIFINTSRGGVSDEAALLRALESGHLGAAGLDVLDGEPDTATHPLVQYARNNDNLLITPHCGGFSPDAVRRVCAHAATKVLEHLGLSGQ